MNNMSPIDLCNRERARRVLAKIRVFTMAAWILTTLGCGTPIVLTSEGKALTITGPTNVDVGSRAQFTVSNPEANAVSWTLTTTSGSPNGTISATGMYEAPTALEGDSSVSVVASAAGFQKTIYPVALVNSAVKASTTIYYVDARSGDDASDGTTATRPWRTVGRVNRANLSAGDSVLFARGATWREPLQVPASGKPGMPITFGVYGFGLAPVINTASPVSDWTPSPQKDFTAYYSTLSNQPYVVTIDDIAMSVAVETTAALNPPQLTVDQLKPGQFVWDSTQNRVYVRLSSNTNPKQHTIEVGQAISTVILDGKTNIRIQGLQLSGGNWNCVRVVNQSDNMELLNNAIKNCGFAGNQGAVFIDGGRQAVVTGNTISYAGNIGVNVSGYNGANSDSFLISGNSINHTGYDCVQLGPSLNGSVAGGIVENNDISHCGLVRQDSAGIDAYLPGSGIIYRYNYVHHNGTANSYSAGVRFDDGSTNEAAYGNVIYLNSSGCVQLTGTRNAFYNNTCYHNNELAAFNYGEINSFISAVSGPPTGLQVMNNLISPSEGKYSVDMNWNTRSGASFVRNFYDATTAQPSFYSDGRVVGFTVWQKDFGLDTQSQTPAPAMLLSPAYFLFLPQTNSPARGTGVPISGYRQDILGTPVPQAPDIGAYQHAR